MARRTRREFLRTVSAAAAAATLWKVGAAEPAAACSDLTEGLSDPCAGIIDRPRGGISIADFEPTWVQTHMPSRLWAEPYDIVEPLAEVEPGQYFEQLEPQDGPRLRVWDPRENRIAFIKAETVGPVGKPYWAEHLAGRDGRWIAVNLKVPQHALAMQADLVMRRSLVAANYGTRGCVAVMHASVADNGFGQGANHAGLNYRECSQAMEMIAASGALRAMILTGVPADATPQALEETLEYLLSALGRRILGGFAAESDALQR